MKVNMDSIRNTSEEKDEDWDLLGAVRSELLEEDARSGADGPDLFIAALQQLMPLKKRLQRAAESLFSGLWKDAENGRLDTFSLGMSLILGSLEATDDGLTTGESSRSYLKKYIQVYSIVGGRMYLAIDE
ncbi:hypothetical protein ILYODFUR_014277 [Ilyodon furcidens]|uniref:Uncharacterized protein n=1 Tax=Ilyodon furcidens TaxID=33524 RepID=A0ABV0UG03_9TELE